MWIFISHIYLKPYYNIGFISADGLGWLHHILFFDFLAVDIFLMLSGCLLYIGYRDYFERESKSKDIDLFYLHRLARIYPLYAVTIIIIGLYHYIDIPHPLFSGHGDQLFEHWQFTLILNSTFMTAWGILPAASWNEPAWTLSVLFLLYVIFPNLVVFLKYTPSKPIMLLLCCYVLIIGYHIARDHIPNLSHSDGTGAILRGMVFFILGCLIGRIFHNGSIETWRWHWILAIITASNIALFILWHEVEQFPMTVFHMLYPLFLLALLYAKGRITAIYGNRICARLGLISYGVYLLHYPACLLIGYVAGDWLQALSHGNALADSWLVALMVLLICWLSHLSFLYIEKPCNRYIKNRFPLNV